MLPGLVLGKKITGFQITLETGQLIFNYEKYGGT